ncbi:hypothetical protein HZB02_02190 [Candidatus Woesearchaeota archaeon]|nr:hypothetical protein [Candidatus Woesearchaeota archaeon]
MYPNPPLELKQMRTTLWIKKGTKKKLDEIGERKDTYDDILLKLLRENTALKQTVIQLETQRKTLTSDAYIVHKPLNRLTLSEKNEKIATLLVPKGTTSLEFTFSYQVPTLPLSPDYRFGITILSEKSGGKEVLDAGSRATEKAKTYMHMIEKIIRLHVNDLFILDEKHILDPDWWKRKLTNLGFSELTYEEDIEREWIKMGIIP